MVGYRALSGVDLFPVPIRDKAYLALKKAIIEGNLSPGERVVENQLAEVLNVSRTPLREAILKLEAEGFIQRAANGGARVSALSVTEVQELFDVRSVLEGLAARLAAKRITDQQLDHLARLIQQIEEADGRQPEIQHISTLGREFHQIILDASGSERCRNLLGLLQDHTDRYRHLTVSMPGRGRTAAKEHARVLAVLCQRDPEKAERAMRSHVRTAGKSMIRKLRQMNFRVE